MKNNETIGLCFSGGGSKAIAQAGVLEFLEELEIKPTIISGTSAGAIIACLYSFGVNPKDILLFFQSIYFFNWRHFTFKKAGIVDSEAFKNYFTKIFGETTIGQLPIAVRITATDLVSGKLKVFSNKTKVVDAILASSAFPGMIAPYEINSKLYSDGGIINHFPTDLLLGNCDYIIGIYVSPIQLLDKKDLNSIKSVTTRAFNILSAQSSYQKFSLCNWVIEPTALCSFSTFETNKLKMNAIYKIGYEAAKSSYENQNKVL